MLYGLKKSVIEKISDIFSGHPEILEVILYGSRAAGNYRQGSDIDLTLKGEILTLKLLNAIESELDDLLLPYEIDLSNYQQIDNPDLIEHIDRVGVVFYTRAGDAQQVIR